MWLIDKVAEEKIKQAIEKGELQDLPGEGQPLRLSSAKNSIFLLRN